MQIDIALIPLKLLCKISVLHVSMYDSMPFNLVDAVVTELKAIVIPINISYKSPKYFLHLKQYEKINLKY